MPGVEFDTVFVRLLQSPREGDIIPAGHHLREFGMLTALINVQMSAEVQIKPGVDQLWHRTRATLRDWDGGAHYRRRTSWGTPPDGSLLQ